MRPTRGIRTPPVRDGPGPWSSMALGLVGSRRRSPRFSRLASWAWTLELEVRPTASPISRTVGGYPRSWTVFRMNSTIRRCRAVMFSMASTGARLARTAGRYKHMFDLILDTRTCVRYGLDRGSNTRSVGAARVGRARAGFVRRPPGWEGRGRAGSRGR